jgi:hypothetical protein
VSYKCRCQCFGNIAQHPTNTSRLDFCKYSDLEEEISSELMNNRESFFGDLHGLLSEEGIITLHVPGNVRAVDSPVAQEHGHRAGQRRDRQATVVADLANLGFQETKEYEESQQAGFTDSRSYVVAFKDGETARNWNRNEAQANREIQKRSVHTKSGTSPFKFFDGALMASYNKFEQGVDGCEQHPLPSWCVMKIKLEAPQHLVSNQAGPSIKLETIVFPNNKSEDVKNDANISLPKQSHCSDQKHAVDNEECEWTDNTHDNRQYVYHES